MTADAALYVQTDANCLANAIWKQDGLDTVVNATFGGRHRDLIATYVLAMPGFLFFLCAFGIGASIAMRIRRFLDLCPGIMRASVLLKHTFKVRQLLWLSAPADWFMESDSEAEDWRYEHPILRTLQEVVVSSEAFVRSTCGHLHGSTRSPTLLDFISMYLTDPSDLLYDYEFPEQRNIVVLSSNEMHIERG